MDINKVATYLEEQGCDHVAVIGPRIVYTTPNSLRGVMKFGIGTPVTEYIGMDDEGLELTGTYNTMEELKAVWEHGS